jgi:lysyl-tRNA synthetase class 2
MSGVPCRDDFRPTASWEHLRLRAGLLQKVRWFFDQRGFLEVETPILSADTVVDRHLDPVGVSVPLGQETRRLWLQTSPEFAMKRLLAAGGTALYQVARVFRANERGPLHNPEFTLVEWYRVGDDLNEGMRLLSDLGECLFERGPAERIAYAEAFERFVGLDPHAASAQDLATAACREGIPFPESLARDDRDGWLDVLLAERVQPQLGWGRPAILYHYPASQAALARICPGPPSVAERFELYVSGIELANGYHELVDAATLRSRIRQTNAQRQHDGKPPLPEQSRLLEAMESGLPSCTGCALGFDRAVMLAVGASTIDEVIAFPFERA